MQIVADANIPIDSDWLPDHVELVSAEGRSLGSAQLKNADALIVRSVTEVNASLLNDTPVKFVATATSGVDHLDKNFLRAQGITWCDAAGSNADAVVDYCLSGLAYWLLLTELDLGELEIGIVGVGHVGSRLAGRLQRLGCKVLLCDPPLERNTPAEHEFVSLERIARCSVVSLHVPYEEQGEFATHNLVSERFLQAMAEPGLLINSCRGGVVDERALLHKLETRESFSAVVDVWLNEPNVNFDLAEKTLLATPHIAGYSKLAKLSAAEIVIDKLLRFFGESPRSSAGNARASESDELIFDTTSKHWETVLQALPIFEWSDSFKQLISQGNAEKGFDLMRRELAARKEFSELSIAADTLSAEESAIYDSLGFRLIGKQN